MDRRSSEGGETLSPLHRLGATCARHPWRVIAAWVAAIAALAGAAAVAGGTLNDDLTVPGTESNDATRILEERYSGLAGGTAQLVFADDGGFVDDEKRAAVAAAVEAVTQLPDVAAVEDPLAATAPRSPDGTTALAEVHYRVQGVEVGVDGAEALDRALDPARAAGVVAEAGGEVPFVNAPTETSFAEAVGLVSAAVILTVAFGSLLAMGIPIASALLGLAGGISALLLVANLTDTPTTSTAVASMIGIGVGIDYALFVVSRFREHLIAGDDPVDAAGWATATAGAAVVFAGGTVMIAILGLFLTGVHLVGMLGLAATLVVGASISLAVTLLPALLGLLGHRLARGRHRVHRPGGQSIWVRWSHQVSDHPWVWLITSGTALVVLAIPLLSLRLGMPDAGSSPESLSVRRAYDLVAEKFGPGTNGPLLVVVASDDGALDGSTMTEVISLVSEDPGVVAVGPPVPNGSGDTAVVTAIPTSSPQDAATADLVDRLRSGPLDEAATDNGVQVLVAGPTASFLDLADRLADRMPLFFTGVIGLTFVLLVVVFRSLLVPLKAVLLNLASIGASYGVVVAVFQWGWGRSLIGVDRELPIVSMVPIFMFAVLFGLSMDYHVFLLSRVREHYDLTGDPRGSVADGLATTARVITSAALVMVAVFSAFVLNEDPMLRMMGLGLAVAILLDATIVRLTLVPATMTLLGHANWWLPSWLSRIVPRIGLEGGGRHTSELAPDRASPA
jgi:RND superfamily putative drug exporter